MNEKVTINISSVLEDLKTGMTRTEIGQKYGLNKRQTAMMFKNPKLKGRKTAKVSFELVDDVPDAKVAEEHDEASVSQMVGNLRPVAQVEESDDDLEETKQASTPEAPESNMEERIGLDWR